MSDTVTLVSPEGHETVVPASQVAAYKARHFTEQTDEAHATSAGEAARQANASGLDTVLDQGASAATFGGSDVAMRVLGGDSEARRLATEERAHPYLAMGGQVLGSVLPGGGVAHLGKALEGVGEKTLVGGATRGAIEGGVLGLGQGVHELAQSEDLSAEHIVSALSSNALLAGTIGGGASLLGAGLERGLGRAKSAIDEHLAASAPELSEDLAGLDRKQLGTAREAELEQLEATRAPKRKEFVDDLGAYRDELKESKAYLAAKAAEDTEVPALVAKADTRVRNLLNNPKAIEANPGRAMDALQQQEHAYQQILENSESIKANATRQAAEEIETNPIGRLTSEENANVRLEGLAKVPEALEKNRALQDRIRDLTAKHSSPRLTAIADATDALSAGGRKPSMLENMLAGSVFGMATGAAAHIPILGQIPGAAHMIGAKASKLVTDLAFGKLGANSVAIAKRSSEAIGKFLDVASKAPRMTAPVATAVLSGVRYAPESHEERRARVASEALGDTKAPKLAEAYKQRAAELRSQVAYDQTGTLAMKPDARQAVADRMAPIRAASPTLADKIETVAARKVEFLASKLPKRPDLDGLQLGPDKWQPSDMEMRKFARYAAAAEDPAAVEERLAHGSITPEDIEAYHAIYPERADAFRQQLISRLSEVQAAMPYQRRLSLSMFAGIPVDPAMNPRILGVLQSSFAKDNAAADEGPPGMSAPKPVPQFGSISKPDPTPAQERAQ